QDFSMPTADELATFGRERQLADRAYNEALTKLDQAIAAAASADARVPAEVSRLATTLIVFLQQITAFVESKDRELAAQMAERQRELLPAIESIRELRAQTAIMHRPVPMLPRQSAPAAASISPVPAPSHQPPATDVKYVAFED